jgi:hypothetical protein
LPSFEDGSADPGEPGLDDGFRLSVLTLPF